ncbi:DUF305 domain-containing protein [Streptomyces griseoviridis]|uniref:DUF305 domain-containing protein n=1 Tax=Streptomyces griseoviridis TaxID=45398 RepID=UPI0034544AF8
MRITRTGIRATTRGTSRPGTTSPLLTAVALAAVLALSACGTGGDGDGGGRGGHGATASPSVTGAHNAQDVAFAQGMIPHHRQALEMAGLAADRADSARVRDLAVRIEKAQDPEIRTLSGWLRAWGEDVPGSGTARHMGHTGMPGMMGGDDMAELEKASGAAFDTRFLTMMVDHHRGAVEMAAAERRKGAYRPATVLAGDIADAQSAEIAEMKGLLGTE